MRSNYVFSRQQIYNFALALSAAGMRQARVCYQIIASGFNTMKNQPWHGGISWCFGPPHESGREW